MKIPISGIGGFVGSNLARGLLENVAGREIIGLDNLSRAGSQLNLDPLWKHGITVRHADLRCPNDLEELSSIDWIIDVAANPSALAGADGSTSSRQLLEHNLYGTDVVRYWNTLNEGYDCVFGSRFIKGGGVIDYPQFKLFLNRLANYFLKVLFRIKLNDTTNAFKAYRREVIEGCQPLIAPHFNITVEIPLKAIVRGFTWTTIPITWRDRRSGSAKLKIKEMGSLYLFICLYIWLEKYFSAGDYRRVSARNPGDA